MKNQFNKWSIVTGTLVLAASAITAQGALVAHWRMNEASGNIADSSGNGFSGEVRTIGGDFAYNQPSVPAGTYGAITVDALTATSFGGSFQGGTNAANRRNFEIGAPAAIAGLITSGPGASDGFGTLTVMGWINLDEISGTQRIFGTGSGGQGGWAFGTTGSGLNFTTYGGADNTIAASLEINTWYHIAATYSDNSLEYFVNGVSIGTDANAGNFTDEGVGNLFRVGASNGGADQFFGRYDEVKIFNTVLTAAQIQAAAIPEPSAALLGGLGFLALLRRRR